MPIRKLATRRAGGRIGSARPVRRSVAWPARALLLLILAGGPAWSQPESTGKQERAEALVRSHAFDQAVAVLRDLLAADPRNRRARELLAFALESMGDLAGERRARAELAAAFPEDPGIQADYGRVLERSGEDAEALRAYRRARTSSPDGPAPDLDAAIARMRGRMAPEFGAPVEVMTDPNANASRVQAGAALPFGPGSRHVVVLVSRTGATAKGSRDEAGVDGLALSLVQRRAGGAYWSAGPRVDRFSTPRGAPADVSVGGVLAGRAALTRSFEFDARGEIATPWDESAVTVLRGGRSTVAEGHLYSHWFSQRLLLQAGGRRRRLSVFAPASPGRPEATESLRIGGADLIVWRDPTASVRGEILDEALTAPTTMSSAVSLGYRHYDVSTRTTPEFASVLALVPRGSVDEASLNAGVASPRRGLWLGVRGGLAWDSARPARNWRAGGSLVWALTTATRLSLAYDTATEVASGLVGKRGTGRLSLHADL